MFTNLPLWAKILLAMGFSIVAVGGVLTYANLRNLEEVIDAAERQELGSHAKDITTGIAAEARVAEILSTLVAQVPLFQQSFAAGDREVLKTQLVPAFQTLKREYGVEQFQFHTPPATSFLRLHSPDKFGDDLSAFRHTVVNTNESRKPTVGLESGVAGLGVRGIVPVVLEGRHLGSVEFGMGFGQSFFDNFKSRHRVDVALYIPDGEGFKPFASTFVREPVLGGEALRQAMRGTPQFGRRQVEGAPRAIYAQAIEDYSGNPIGVVEVAMDRSSYQRALDRARTIAFLVGGGALLMGLLLAILTARGVARRIGVVVAGVNRVAQGDLTVEIAAAGRDEIGALAEAAGAMRRQLHDVASRVRDHAIAVHTAAQEISGAVEGQAATSSQMSASVAEITSTMEELSASSNQIAEHSKSVVEIANQTWESSKQGADSMRSLMGRMEGIRADNQQSLREIMELGGKSKQISKVMEIIDAVADQTKLITFNAALEASSAGEAGRRFGVVASEIRRLADSVTESTGEIASKINEIQEAISRLVVVSEKGAGGIDAGMLESARTVDLLGTLVGAARQTTSAAQQISLSTQQQKTASGQVVVALREIVSASAHTAQSITRISQVSKEMAGVSAELGEAVGRFRIEERGTRS